MRTQNALTNAHGKLERSLFALLLAAVFLATGALAQNPEYKRSFPQSKATVESVLKDPQFSRGGYLPALDGFTLPGEFPFDRYQRGYFQCAIEVTAAPSGGSLVRVTAKITAWYSDPLATRSGYRVLASNGRIETDFLDRLQQALAAKPAATEPSSGTAPSRTPDSPRKALSSEPALSAPGLGAPMAGEPARRASPVPFNTTGLKLPDAPAKGQVASTATQKAVADRHAQELAKQARNLEEILRNQSHPANLAAVKKSGTPVFASPNDGAQVLFQAAAQDEFEILDTNVSWVHVRVSGLSRGWILRSGLEMPDSAAEPVAPAPQVKPTLFQIESEQIASFPGTWEPLQGKTVKIVSVQQADERARASSPEAKREFAATVFANQYGELAATSSSAAGLVVIFDTADGGLIAATLPALQQWRAGTLSDEGFWRRCLFDPPEAFESSGTR